jgi:hypothetical protein
MGYTDEFLSDVQSQIAADDDVLAEARIRTNLVLEIALSFPGARRTFRSGSLAVHTFNHPVTDGDGGVVLDRRYYPALGPDGAGEIPNRIVAETCALLGPEVRKAYPEARCHTSKRGPKVLFRAPLKGQDPTVDLVLGLERRDADGLWIPHLEKKRWDASHPEQHVRLLNAEPLSLRRLRRRVIRLLKAWNKQWTERAFSPYHLSVLALLYVESGMSAGTALHTVFEKAAKYLESGSNTKDPASVSPPVKLLLDRSVAVDRLQKAATNMARALDHDDDKAVVQTALNRVFRHYVDPPAGDGLGSTVSGLQGVTGVSTALLGLRPSTHTVATTGRAYGGPAPR